jgi:hypothetical protein
MNFLNQILPLLFSLTGFFFGLILSFIAPEELKPGKKYFLFIKRIIFLLLFFTVNFFFYQSGQYFYLIPFTIIALILFVMGFRNKSIYYEIPNYLLFVIPYFLNNNQILHLLLPSLLFLYGLPAGTLARKRLVTSK